MRNTGIERQAFRCQEFLWRKNGNKSVKSSWSSGISNISIFPKFNKNETVLFFYRGVGVLRRLSSTTPDLNKQPQPTNAKLGVGKAIRPVTLFINSCCKLRESWVGAASILSVSLSPHNQCIK